MIGPIQAFSTCPASTAADRATVTEAGAAYRPRVIEVARWSEAAGCEGILVYTDNRLVDPWLTAQLVIQATERLPPLVAIRAASWSRGSAGGGQGAADGARPEVHAAGPLAPVGGEPLDVDLADDVDVLMAMRADEPPIFILKRDVRLEQAWPQRAERMLTIADFQRGRPVEAL